MVYIETENNIDSPSFFNTYFIYSCGGSINLFFFLSVDVDVEWSGGVSWVQLNNNNIIILIIIDNM